MSIIITGYKCCICNQIAEVLHTTKVPTVSDFHASAMLKDCDGKGKHVCYDCENTRMEESEDDE